LARSICLINAHPDASPERFCAALATAYETAAREAGHHLTRFELGDIDIECLGSAAEMATPPPQGPITQMQAAINAADHLTLIYPMWVGTMPAKLKALLEQLARGSFFLAESEGGGWPAQKMKGKSARVVMTMGMPVIAYRLMFGSASLRTMEKGVLGIAGFKPVRHDLCGMVEGSAAHRERFLARIARRGAEGA